MVAAGQSWKESPCEGSCLIDRLELIEGMKWWSNSDATALRRRDNLFVSVSSRGRIREMGLMSSSSPPSRSEDMILKLFFCAAPRILCYSLGQFSLFRSPRSLVFLGFEAQAQSLIFRLGLIGVGRYCPLSLRD